MRKLKQTWKLSVAVALTAVWLLLWGIPIHAEAATGGNQIAADELKNISRLSFQLRDAYQTPYTVYIFAKDEKMSVLTEEDYWTNNKTGDKSYTGTYRAAVVKNGEKFGTVQSLKLPFGGVTLPQTWHYTVKSSGKPMPDLLILSEWGTSNFNLVYPYVIRSGTLEPLQFINPQGKKLDASYPASRGDGVRSLSGSRLQFKFYNNSVFKYAVNTFKLNLSKLELQVSDSRYVNQGSWPNAGTGDRAYLENLKAAAIGGYLPANPQIKLGMKFNTLKNRLKTAKFTENGEWGAFYGYKTYAVGFNEYMHELGPSSYVMVFNIFADQQNLAVGNVKYWLGKPKEQYWNEAEGSYGMIYTMGKHSLAFHYDEEDGFIQLITIY
ncbi:hypothetical protein [Paenibacillus donghaensis]|uniref:Uncharacterized protein n=1 Tax=Paenibacillus donghaensis TaxID=414771 RepID=A0A2Z2KLY9_9BACL|nr:hypothetical protein [Paenibacillus donghaensis]ASA24490.1 hypothetical protein B9T62_29295 [Paenibacillus donghaensis]